MQTCSDAPSRDARRCGGLPTPSYSGFSDRDRRRSHRRRRHRPPCSKYRVWESCRSHHPWYPLPYRRGRPPIRCRQRARYPCRRRPTYSRRPRRRDRNSVRAADSGRRPRPVPTNSAACRRHKSDRRGRGSVHPPKDSSRNHCRRRPSRPSALRPSCSRNRANRRSYCCCNRVRPTSCSRPCPRRRCRCKVRIRRRPC